MARTLFGAEKGYRLYGENSDTFVDVLFGSAAPGGDAGDQDAAPIGSLYIRTNGELFSKDANAGATTDWVRTTKDDYFAQVLGITEGDTDMGTFTGTTLTDNADVKTLLQELETAVENVSGGTEVTNTGITAAITQDEVNVDATQVVEWELIVFEEAAPANKKFGKITAMHNGTASADATNTDDSLHTRLRLGSNFNFVADVDLDGAGASQTMRLRVSSSTAGVTVITRRTSVG